jgi:hypothetical protein
LPAASYTAGRAAVDAVHHRGQRLEAALVQVGAQVGVGVEELLEVRLGGGDDRALGVGQDAAVHVGVHLLDAGARVGEALDVVVVVGQALVDPVRRGVGDVETLPAGDVVDPDQQVVGVLLGALHLLDPGVVVAGTPLGEGVHDEGRADQEAAQGEHRTESRADGVVAEAEGRRVHTGLAIWGRMIDLRLSAADAAT